LGASTRREVELALTVTTANSETLADIAAKLKTVAKEGGSAAPELNRLALEVDRLGKQSQALDALGALASDSTKLGQASTEAAASTATLKTRLLELAGATKEAQTAERDSQTALRDAKRAVQEKADEVKALKNATDLADRGTLVYTDSLRKLTNEQLAARAQVRELNAAYDSSKTTLREAQDAQATLGKEYRVSEAASRDAARALKDVATAVEAANAKLKEAGGVAGDIATAQAKVQQAYAATRDSIKQTVSAEEAKAVALKNASDAATRAATAAKDAGAAVQNALGAVGVKAAKDLEREIKAVQDAMVFLKDKGILTGNALDTAMAQGRSKVAGLEKDLRAATGEVTLLDQAGNLLNTTMGKLAVFGTVATAALAVGRAFFTATKEIEGMRLGLGQVYGSAETASKQIEFMRVTANRAGISVSDISQSFTKFSASMQLSNISLKESNDLFAAVTQASGTLGLSGDRVNRMLEALSQIAGKGVVSMEELRQQLGDSLPGAVALTAKGLGITQQELFKLVEAGKLTASEFIVPFTKALKGLEGEVNTTSGAWERLKSTTTIALQALGDTGAAKLLTTTFQALGVVVGSLGFGFASAADAAFTVTRAFGSAAGAFATGQPILKAVDSEFASMERRLTELARTLGFSEKVMSLFGLNAQEAGKAAEATTTAITSASGAWTQLQVGITKANEEMAHAITLAEKEVAAADIQAKTRTALAQITGDTVTVLREAAEAADIEAAAAKREADARNQQVAASRAFLEVELLILAKEGDRDESKKKEIDKLKQLIEQQQALADKTTAASSSADIAAVKQRLLQQTHEDNSASVGRLRKAYEDQQTALRFLIDTSDKSITSQREIAAQAARTAAAQALYNDALQDTITKLKAKGVLEDANGKLIEAGLNLQLAQAKSAERLAVLAGDEVATRTAQIKQREIEIKLIEAKVKLAYAEADASIAEAEAVRAEAIATGKNTVEKLAAIEAAITLAKVKKLGADAIRESASALQEEINRLREGKSATENSTQSKKDNKTATDSSTQANNENTQSIQGQNVELTKQSQVLDEINAKYGQSQKDFTDKFGKTSASKITTASESREVGLKDQNAVDNSLRYKVADKLNAGGLTKDDEADIAATIAALDQNDAVNRSVGPSALSTEGLRSAQEDKALRARLVARLAELRAGGGALGAPPSPVPTGGTSSAPATNTPTAPPARTINLVLSVNGRPSETVPTTEEGAAAIVRQLKAAQLGAGA
jgi:tape measure domain-containing protein